MIVRHQIRRGFLLGAAYVLTAVVVKALRLHDAVSAEAAMRLMGVLMGLIVVILANAVPKRLVPLARLYCDPAREQALRRFAARVMLLGGLGFALAYAFAPIAIAPKLAVWLLEPPALVFGGILIHSAWRRRKAMRGGA
jgi:hypothetical protein